GPGRRYVGDKLIAICGRTAARALGAKHPRFICCPTQQSDARAFAMEVMKQDLNAACWQATMTRATVPDPTTAPARCTAEWDARPRDAERSRSRKLVQSK